MVGDATAIAFAVTVTTMATASFVSCAVTVTTVSAAAAMAANAVTSDPLQVSLGFYAPVRCLTSSHFSMEYGHLWIWLW